ncbi:MAG: hypothetical protein PHX43_03255 [Alphaproteobacteria bacterium]|nr:hypothetical protein [Alphaproteobacteria bacterium]
MNIGNPYLINRFREKLPEAAGYALSDAELCGIAKTALNQCDDYLNYGNTEWLNYPSIQNSLLFLAYIYGPEHRFYSELSSVTHPIKVAHSVANEGALLDMAYDPEYLAFIALNHDSVEDAVKDNRSTQTDDVAYDLLVECLNPTTASPQEIRKYLWALTDSIGSKGSDRRKEQVRRAHVFGPIVVFVRFYDKFYNALDDLQEYNRAVAFLGNNKNGIRDITKPKEIGRAWRHAQIKFEEVINYMPQEISLYHLATYTQIVEELRYRVPQKQLVEEVKKLAEKRKLPKDFSYSKRLVPMEETRPVLTSSWNLRPIIYTL